MALDPLTGGLIAGGLSFLGGATGASKNLKIARETNAMRVAEAKKNRDFQQEMSSTAYQRAMQDMEKAGLNPMLAYKQGGASTPGGSQANLVNPQYNDPLAPATTSAIDSIQKQVQSSMLTQQTFLNKVDTFQKVAESKARAENARASAVKNMMQTELLEKDLAEAGVHSDFWKKYGKEYNEWRKLMMTVSNTANAASDVIGAFSPLKPGSANMHKLRRNEMILNQKTGEILKEHKRWGR